MSKLIWLAAIGCLVFKWQTGRWPWQARGALPGRGRGAEQALAHARALLGLGAGASHGEIIEAHKRLLMIVHPDRGGTSEQVHEATAARDLLLADLARRSAAGQ
ncbi:MAG TPA: molecular chaperone DnaJ [Novosphingobium sp.]|nr:molecular chaperone DnaJ [Novosphingobium sp.]HZV10342.1 molecular chaperone DnaJ [Novosphingobium sp.]